MSPHDRLRWEGETRVVVDDIEFACLNSPDPSIPQLYLCKDREHTLAYADLLDEFEGGNIVELGIYDGGSAALLTLLARPRRLVAVDLAPEPAPRLTAFIDELGLHDQVRAHYGLDQGDRESVRHVLDDAFGAEPLDLVIDDASHLLAPTRASFETIFPRVRPGGLYCIEDWNWQHLVGSRLEEIIEDDAEREAFEKQLTTEVDVEGSSARAEFSRRLAHQILTPGSEARTEFDQLLASERSGPRAELARQVEGQLDDPHLTSAARIASVADFLDQVGGAEGDRPGPNPGAGRDDAAVERPRTAMSRPAETAGASPLVALAVELMLLRARSSEIVSSIVFGDYWIRVRRGPAELDPATFRLDDVVVDDYGLTAR